jgi:hypothetical protein
MVTHHLFSTHTLPPSVLFSTWVWTNASPTSCARGVLPLRLPFTLHWPLAPWMRRGGVSSAQRALSSSASEVGTRTHTQAHAHAYA